MTVNDSQQAAPAPARTGIWYNKRELSRIDIPVPHTLSSHNDGWRVDFSAAGRIRVVGANGPNQKIDVVEGDSLLSSGEDFYLSVSTAPADDPKDEHSKAKQQGREQAADSGTTTAPSGGGTTTPPSGGTGSTTSSGGATSGGATTQSGKTGGSTSGGSKGVG